MKLNLLAFAIPFFMFFMVLEYLIAYKRKKKIHHFKETIANINVGIGERLSDMLCSGLFFFVFTWLHHHWAIFKIENSWVAFAVLFVITDFIWYWYHRLGHKVNLFWSVHVVHHQSDDFNFTVSARITIFQSIVRGIFWSLLPIIGFSPQMVTAVLLIHGAYPFFIHTQLAGKLGYLEYIFVTPSHHRVHHSSNPEYLDKNYGDVLIFWDKLFGTFKEETLPAKFGLTKPLNNYSFLWQHFHFIIEMLWAIKRADGWRRKLNILFGPPDIINPNTRMMVETKLFRNRKQYTSTMMLQYYVFLQTIITMVILFFTVLFEYHLTALQLAMLSIFIVLSVIHTGAMIEQRLWIFDLDFTRLIVVGYLLYSFYPSPLILILYNCFLFVFFAFYKTCHAHYSDFFYALSS